MPTEKRQRQKEGQQARKEAALLAARKQQRKKRRIVLAVLVVVVFGVMGLLSLTGNKDDKGIDTSAKPKVTVPKGAAPTKLVKKDLVVGKGAAVKAGDTVEVNYVGVSYKDGKQFDASWDNGQTYSFEVGKGNVIKGWDQGVPGMKVGGRRQLVIPGSLAYGDEDTGDGRPHGALVFVIDLVSIK